MISGGSKIFRRGGAGWGCANLLFDIIVANNFIKMKEIGKGAFVTSPSSAAGDILFVPQVVN